MFSCRADQRAMVSRIAALAGDEVAEQLGEAAKAIERSKDKTHGALRIQLLPVRICDTLISSTSTRA
jgi:hypothetical protein